MISKDSIRELMEQIRDSHREFRRIWLKVRAEELSNYGLDAENMPGLLATEESRLKLFDANGIAYKAAQSQAESMAQASANLFNELPFKDFEAGKSDAIDTIIDFLEVDVLALGCGYIKEKCYRKLKSLALNQQQILRLRHLIVELCQCRGQRREWRELARLMIKHADKPLIQQLKNLVDKHESLFTRQKAARVLNVILHSRPDLK